MNETDKKPASIERTSRAVCPLSAGLQGATLGQVTSQSSDFSKKHQEAAGPGSDDFSYVNKLMEPNYMLN